MTAFRCAAASRDRGEPGFATASGVQRWVLVEQPGPWGGEAPPLTRMDPDAWTAVRRRASAAGARMLIVRRPGGEHKGDARRVFFADSRVGHTRLLAATVEAEELLTDLQLPTDDEDNPDPHWQPVAGPLLCVCTQGKHDTCCAVFGRPLAAAVQAAAPELTWECSHIGGDRFAPNLLVLPEGLYFGRLEPEAAEEFVEGLAAGRMPLDAFRGRSSLSGPAQAASYFAATAQREDRIDAFTVLTSRSVSGSDSPAWIVRLASGEQRYDVTVTRRMSAEPQLLTCDSEQPKAYPVYDLVELVQLAPAEPAT